MLEFLDWQLIQAYLCSPKVKALAIFFKWSLG